MKLIIDVTKDIKLQEGDMLLFRNGRFEPIPKFSITADLRKLVNLLDKRMLKVESDINKINKELAYNRGEENELE